MRFISVFTHEPNDRPPTEAEMATMGKLIEDSMKAGWLIATEGVHFGATGVRVRKSAGGKFTVTDGPFAETKEVLGGYALLKAESKEEVVKYTRQFLDVVGQGSCEIYQLYEMPAESSPEAELLRAAYAAFNARDFDAAFATMSPDVAWPRAFKGGVVRGHHEVKAYWTEQWTEIDPHVEPISFHPQGAGRILVDVHQVVRDLNGAILGDEHVGHRFTIKDGLIQTMEVSPLPSSSTGV